VTAISVNLSPAAEASHAWPTSFWAPSNGTPDIVFKDFEKDPYAGWTAEGTAFGSGPIAVADIPEYQGDVNAHGTRVVNFHASAPGGSVAEKDNQTGTLTSDEFMINRRFVRMLLGGGNHPGKTGVDVLIDGQVVATVTGRNSNRME
jgi:non-lysosomal glucosylceramidase